MKLKELLNTIYWWLKKLTKKGREDYIFHIALSGIQQSNVNQNIAKIEAGATAKKLLKPKKILAFNKGKSITKPKKSNHQVIAQTAKKHATNLKNTQLKLTKKGTFKNA